jgi:hypothetical protein
MVGSLGDWIADHWPEMNASEWSNWMTAVATIGALIAAILAWRVSYRVARRYEDQDRKGQASLVAVWITREQKSEVLPQEGSNGSYPDYMRFDDGMTEDLVKVRFAEPTVHIRNASEAPVYDVILDFYYRTEQIGGMADESLEVIAPGDNVAIKPTPRVLWASEGEVRRDLLAWHMADYVDMSWKVRVGIDFTDAADQRWTRNSRGRLETWVDPHPEPRLWHVRKHYRRWRARRELKRNPPQSSQDEEGLDR